MKARTIMVVAALCASTIANGQGLLDRQVEAAINRSGTNQQINQAVRNASRPVRPAVIEKKAVAKPSHLTELKEMTKKNEGDI